MSLGFIAAIHLDGGAAIADDAVGQAKTVQYLREHQLVHLVVLGDEDIERLPSRMPLGIRHLPDGTGAQRDRLMRKAWHRSQPCPAIGTPASAIALDRR